MLESLDVALAEQECDAVYVASPVVLHARQTIASLRARRNVLCEKPMAMNYDEALSMQRMPTRSAGSSGSHTTAACIHRLFVLSN